MKTSITLKDSRLVVASAYNPVFVERFREIEGRKFNGDDKSWDFPACREALMSICDVCGILPWMLDSDVQKVMDEAGVVIPEAKPVDLSLIDGHEFLTEPFGHQRSGLARLLGNKRWLIADEMGCGKSHIVCNRIRQFYLDFPRARVLILCPKSVTTGWQEQLWLHAMLQSEIVQGDSKKRSEILTRPYGVKIANYELLLHSDFSVVSWDVVVLDECHRCKGFTTQTSKAVRKLTGMAILTYGLSGTPAPNGLEDWFGVLSAIDPTLLTVKTKTAFEARYCVKREIQPGVWKVAGYKNVQELHGYIASITSRVTKDQVLDLPPKTYTKRCVSLDGEQARVYRELKKDAVARIKTLKQTNELTIRNVLTESLRLLQVVGGHFPADDGSVTPFSKMAKLSSLEDVLDELGTKQCVIWCAFVAEVEMLRKWLEAKGFTVSTIVGGMTGNQRSEDLEAFRSKQTQFCVGTAAAGGTGINQLVGADTCVYYSRNFSLTDYLQSQDRCHRIGTVSPVTIIKLIASGTIDEKVDAALDSKQDMMELMLRSPEEMF